MSLTATEPVLAIRWVSSILVPDLAVGHGLVTLVGGLWNVPPAGVLSPYGLVRNMTSEDDLTGLENSALIWSPILVQVNVYDRKHGDFSRIEPLAARIYELLNGQGGSIDGGIVYGCRRMRVNADTQTVGDEVERFVNQQFLIEASAL